MFLEADDALFRKILKFGQWVRAKPRMKKAFGEFRRGFFGFSKNLVGGA